MGGKNVDLSGVTRGFQGHEPELPHAALLVAFAEAVTLRDAPGTAAARSALHAALGDAGLVDAAATVAAFHGFVRVADSIGIPYDTAAGGQDAPDVREQAGINDFPRVRDDLRR